jgi:hypothetical protein
MFRHCKSKVEMVAILRESAKDLNLLLAQISQLSLSLIKGKGPGGSSLVSTASAAVGHWYLQALPKPSLDFNRLDVQMSQSFSQLGSGSLAVPVASRILQLLAVLKQRQQDPPGFAAGLQALAVRNVL